MNDCAAKQRERALRSSLILILSTGRYLVIRIFRLILCTVLLTSKFFNDVYYSNEQIGSVGGVSLYEINMLELYYLDMIDYLLFISPEDFCRYLHGLQGHFAEITRLKHEQTLATSPQQRQLQNQGLTDNVTLYYAGTDMAMEGSMGDCTMAEPNKDIDFEAQIPKQNS